MLTTMFNTLAGKRICLFGFAFKADTGDTRETPALTVASRLVEENARVVISDPQALDNAREDTRSIQGDIQFIEDPYAAASGCHAIALMTEWDLYRTLDYEKIFDSMLKPAFIFDGRNIADHDRLFEIGFNVFPIGKPKKVHF